MNKLKVGDKCRVIANTCGHFMPIGHETEIVSFFVPNGYYVTEGRVVDDDDVELIEPVNNQKDAR